MLERKKASRFGGNEWGEQRCAEDRSATTRREESILAGLLKDSVPVFDPDKPTSAKSWLRKCEQYFDILGLCSVHSRKVVLSTLVCGRAAVWLEAVGNHLSSWGKSERFFSERIRGYLVCGESLGGAPPLERFWSF